jgi:quercetin dioxygenase-like cupin family protein
VSDVEPSHAWLFGSAFLGGFECANQLTRAGHRIDGIAATQHDRFAAEDYARCRALGIRAIRESARWTLADRGGRLDLAEVRRLAALARDHGLTVIWDLFHYGYPDDLDATEDGFADRLVDRLATFAGAVARVVRDETDGDTWYTPVNEISYTAWAAGEHGLMAPGWRDRGWEYKVALVRAAIAAFDAIRSVDPTARALSAEPLVRLHVHRDLSDPDERAALQAEVDDFNARVVSEAYDMLAGRVAPELGGSPDHLGVVGVNYYEGNQWTRPTPTLPQHFLGRDDPAWLPLSGILAELSERYRAPIVISEAGSTAEARPGWLRHLTAEAEAALARGVDLQGICLYPLVTSPDWNDPAAFFDGGIWDVTPRADGTLERRLVPEVAEALREAQSRLEPDSVPVDLEALAEESMPDTPAADVGNGVDTPPILFGKLASQAVFSPDGFVSVPVFAGESLVADLYCFEPGRSIAGHRHDETEHVLTTIQGSADVRVGDQWVTLGERESVLVPAGLYHGIHNPSTERLIVQQVSSPKPWDARFGGPRPSDAAMRGEPGP